MPHLYVMFNEFQCLDLVPGTNKPSSTQICHKQLGNAWVKLRINTNYQISTLLQLLSSVFIEHVPGARHVAKYWIPNNKQHGACPQRVHRYY